MKAGPAINLNFEIEAFFSFFHFLFSFLSSLPSFFFSLPPSPSFFFSFFLVILLRGSILLLPLEGEDHLPLLTL